MAAAKAEPVAEGPGGLLLDQQLHLHFVGEAVGLRRQLDRVDRLHFFLCESDYADKDEMTFDIGGFQLCKLKREVSKLPRGQAAMALCGRMLNEGGA